MNKLSHIIPFAWQRHRGIFILSILAFLCVIIGVVGTNDNTVKILEKLGWWTNWIDPIIGVGTFLMTLVISSGKILESWEDSIPKRLTVKYQYKGKTVMVCKRAFLSSEADIRNLGQQIGSQMAKVKPLFFEPYNIVSQMKGNLLDEKQNYYRAYEVVFQLTKMPAFKEGMSSGEEIHISMLMQKTLVWEVSENPMNVKKETWEKR